MKVCLALLMLVLASSASAQTVIVVGPASVIEWTVPGAGSPVNALLLTYALTVDTAAPKVLTSVACTGTTNPVCTVPAAGNAPIGTHTLTLTASDGVTTSLPSAPFAYVTLLVPMPTGLQIR